MGRATKTWGVCWTLLTLIWAGVAGTQVHAAEDYRLGAGDSVRITVYNSPDLTTETEIAADGTISFPLIGRVKLGGLSQPDAEQAISRLLVEGRFLREAQVNVAVSDYRSQQASVLGDVKKPGKYPVGPQSTLTDLLARAGGITAEGSRTVTLVTHDAAGRKAERSVDLDALLAAGDDAGDPSIGSGDIVFVPPAAVFYIYGEVQKPGAYPLQRHMTVRQAMSLGGGLTLRGTERGLTVTASRLRWATCTCFPTPTTRSRA